MNRFLCALLGHRTTWEWRPGQDLFPGGYWRICTRCKHRV